MTDTTNDRRADRFSIPLKAHYSYGLVDGVGVLTNVSYSGALIEGISTWPEIGTLIVLCVYLKSPLDVGKVNLFELSGVVVRHSSTGFAVEYEDNHNPDVRRMLSTAAAIVAHLPGESLDARSTTTQSDDRNFAPRHRSLCTCTRASSSRRGGARIAARAGRHIPRWRGRSRAP